ncbi:hypothetical protein NB037_03035 [Rathayibacter sp. ZW T2_19]|uniref:Uncharacterized protein n=1 Tax=Rathayibacter rubneri TaxID=2950106 RepID=A0A9X2IRY8_9MICO|nr:hypothetical protein [Rathayibacter rubneri]MCM6761382.1 hypothetical protein [Rathayibacter rubneri]
MPRFINDTAIGKKGGVVALNAKGQPVNGFGRESQATQAIDFRSYLDNTGTPTTDAAWDALVLTAIQDSITADMPLWFPNGDYPINVANWRSATSDYAFKKLRIRGQGTGTRFLQRDGKRVFDFTADPGTGTTITAASIGQLALASSGDNTPYGVMTTITMPAAYANTQPGDALFLTSSDLYNTQYVSGLDTYQGQWLVTTGLVAKYTTAGTGLPLTDSGKIVTGATSGATAYLLGAGATAAGDTYYLYRPITGTFTSGENITIGGTTRGAIASAPMIAVPGLLADTYTTNVRLYRPDPTCTLTLEDCSISTVGAADRAIGSSQRADAIVVSGAQAPTLRNVTIDYALASAIVLRSVHRANIIAPRINRLPNLANTSEQAYGYGVEIQAAATGTQISNGDFTMCRHGVTTNPANKPSTYPTGGVNVWSCGVPVSNTVSDSVASHTYSAAFDTHGGARGTKFIDCTARAAGAGARATTTEVGFQNRAHDTTFEGCVAEDCFDGFRESGATFKATYDNTVRYINCRAIRFLRYGFNTTSQNDIADQTTAETRYYWENCEAEGSPTAILGTQQGYGFAIFNAWDVEINGGRVSGFVTGPVRRGGLVTKRMFVHDQLVDYSNSPATASNGVVSWADIAGSGELIVDNIRVIRDTANTLPAYTFTNPSGTAYTIRSGDVTYLGGSAPSTSQNPSVLTINGLTRRGGRTIIDTTLTWNASVPIATGTVRWAQVNASGSGIKFGDQVVIAPPAAINGGVTITAHVHGADAIRVQVLNMSGADYTPPTGSWKLWITRS